MHGHGVLEYSNGSRYEGHFKEDLRHGHGVFEFASGNRYEGQFKDGKIHGHGVYEFASGGRYEGGWKDGKKHGYGVHEFAKGGRYEGGFKVDKEHGHGIIEYANGTRYEGGWKDGKKNGFGKLIGDNSWKDRPKTTHLISLEAGMKDGWAHGMGVRFVWRGDEGKFYRDEGFFIHSEEGLRIRECREIQVEPKTIRKGPSEPPTPPPPGFSEEPEEGYDDTDIPDPSQIEGAEFDDVSDDVLEWIEVPAEVMAPGAAVISSVVDDDDADDDDHDDWGDDDDG